MPHTVHVTHSYKHGNFKRHKYWVQFLGISRQTISFPKYTFLQSSDDFIVWWFLNEDTVPLTVQVRNFKRNNTPVSNPVAGILQGQVAPGRRLLLYGEVVDDPQTAPDAVYKYDVVVTGGGVTNTLDPELEIRRIGGRRRRRSPVGAWTLGAVAIGALAALAAGISRNLPNEEDDGEQ